MATGSNLAQSEDKETGSCWVAVSSDLCPSVTLVFDAACQHQAEQRSFKSDPLHLDKSRLVCFYRCFLLHHWLRKSWISFSVQTHIFTWVPSHKTLCPPRPPNIQIQQHSTRFPQDLRNDTYQAESMAFILSQCCLRRIAADPLPSSVEKLAQKAQATSSQELGGRGYRYHSSQSLGWFWKLSPSKFPACWFPSKDTTFSQCCYFVRAWRWAPGQWESFGEEAANRRDHTALESLGLTSFPFFPPSEVHNLWPEL